MVSDYGDRSLNVNEETPPGGGGVCVFESASKGHFRWFTFYIIIADCLPYASINRPMVDLHPYDTSCQCSLRVYFIMIFILVEWVSVARIDIA